MVLQLIGLGAGVISLLLIHWQKKKHEEKLCELEKRKKSDNIWYKFLFITNENADCGEHLKEERPCGEKCSHTYLQTIREHLRSAKSSISLCIYHVTLESILDELSQVHSRKINVRIVSDKEMAHHSASIMKRLKEIGICLFINL